MEKEPQKEIKLMPMFSLITHLHKLLLYIVQNIEDLPKVQVDLGDKILTINVEKKE